jgi:hypothetical protein
MQYMARVANGGKRFANLSNLAYTHSMKAFRNAPLTPNLTQTRPVWVASYRTKLTKHDRMPLVRQTDT